MTTLIVAAGAVAAVVLLAVAWWISQPRHRWPEPVNDTLLPDLGAPGPGPYPAGVASEPHLQGRYAVVRFRLARWVWVWRRSSLLSSGPQLPDPPAPAPPPADEILVPAPYVQTDTGAVVLGYYLREDGPGGWVELVKDMYGAVAIEPGIARYFAHRDAAAMSSLQRHFVAVIVQVTSRGLTRGDFEAMRRAHQGRMIDGVAYDRVIGVLARLLISRGVPDNAIGGVARLAAELRPAIVAT